jgi:hypothetical protein
MQGKPVNYLLQELISSLLPGKPYLFNASYSPDKDTKYAPGALIGLPIGFVISDEGSTPVLDTARIISSGKVIPAVDLLLFSQPITENLKEGAVPSLSAEIISTFIGKISFDAKASEAIAGWNFNEINPDLEIHASDCYGLLIAAEELSLGKSDKLNIQLAISSKKNIIA